MTHRGLIPALTTALLLAPAFTRAQIASPLAWDADAFAAIKSHLADVPAPAAPASRAETAASHDPHAKTRALFQHPLIIGASVSAGFRAESPALRVARRFGAADAVVSFAVPGQTGATQVSRLTDANLSAASVVVGVDLFFWDTQRDCSAGIAAVAELFKKLAAHQTPVVLANVPELRAPLIGSHDNSCRAQMNEKIEKTCAQDPACTLLDLNALYAKARKDGFAALDGQKIPFNDLLSDGLHLSDAGSRLTAQAIVDAVEKTPAPN